MYGQLRYRIRSLQKRLKLVPDKRCQDAAKLPWQMVSARPALFIEMEALLLRHSRCPAVGDTVQADGEIFALSVEDVEAAVQMPDGNWSIAGQGKLIWDGYSWESPDYHEKDRNNEH